MASGGQALLWCLQILIPTEAQARVTELNQTKIHPDSQNGVRRKGSNLGMLVGAGAKFYTSKNMKLLNKAEILLTKIRSSLLPGQVFLHNGLEGQVPI